jgi:hypothetical protein
LRSGIPNKFRPDRYDSQKERHHSPCFWPHYAIPSQPSIDGCLHL